MTYYYVRSLPPLCESKKILHTMEELIEYIKLIETETQKFRNKLWDEELIENDIPRYVGPKDLDDGIAITRVDQRSYTKRFKLFRESPFKEPFERKLQYVMTSSMQKEKS